MVRQSFKQFHLIIFMAIQLFLISCTKSTCLDDKNSYDFPFKVYKIWSNGTHAAFTSLIKFKDMYYCTFREGYSHIFNDNGEADGKIRIIRSHDGDVWESVLLFSIAGLDLRDPKLSVTPDDRLMLNFGGSVYRNKLLLSRASYVMFSKDGNNFGEAINIKIDESVRTNNDWLWRVTWYNGNGYGVCYSIQSENETWLSLLRTVDGINYKLIKKIEYDGFPNESTIRFMPDGRMAMIVRRDKDDCSALWGTSISPFDKWKFKKIGFRVAGPDLLLLNDERSILATRIYTSETKTAIFEGDMLGNFKKKFVLPSQGDTSYPGLLQVGNEIWVTYYSSSGHDNNTEILLARIPINLF